jgi:hypothetical protein
VLLPPQVTCAYPLFKVDLPGHEQALMAEPIGVAQPALSLWLHCETEDNTTLRGCCAHRSEAVFREDTPLESVRMYRPLHVFTLLVVFLASLVCWRPWLHRPWQPCATWSCGKVLHWHRARHHVWRPAASHVRANDSRRGCSPIS